MLSRRSRKRGLAVALLGPDGAGKSTLAGGLAESLAVEERVRIIYAGPYPKAGRRPRRLPGIGTGLVIGRLTGGRAKAMWHRALGRTVIFDRHPYDALLAPPAKRRRTDLRRAIIGRAGLPPDLILVLDAPAEVLFERKGEHDVPSLDEQRRRYASFAETRPNAVLLDTTTGAEEVRRRALAELAAIRLRRDTT